MPSTPGTVSKDSVAFYWWTAGTRKPNRRTRNQNRLLQLTSVKGILTSKELRLGQKEWVNLEGVAITVLDRGREEFVDPAYRNARFQASPVCCLADIPIMHLAYHSDRYGKFAIGFYRQAIIEAGFSPVLYQLEQSKMLGQLYAAVYTLSDFCHLNLSKVFEVISQDPTLSAIDGNGLETNMPFLQRHLELHSLGRLEAKKGIENLLSFVKSFKLDEFDTIYCERECAIRPQFRFSFADVAMVVMPSNAQEIEYLSPFIEFAKSIKLPRRIPTVAWEDLVEH